LELEPAEATAAIELVPVNLDEGRPPIGVDSVPIRPETVADHKDIETAAARRFGGGAEQRQHARRLSWRQYPHSRADRAQLGCRRPAWPRLRWSADAGRAA
jgi:hypothetical protein